MCVLCVVCNKKKGRGGIGWVTERDESWGPHEGEGVAVT